MLHILSETKQRVSVGLLVALILTVTTYLSDKGIDFYGMNKFLIILCIVLTLLVLYRDFEESEIFVGKPICAALCIYSVMAAFFLPTTISSLAGHFLNVFGIVFIILCINNIVQIVKRKINNSGIRRRIIPIGIEFIVSILFGCSGLVLFGFLSLG